MRLTDVKIRKAKPEAKTRRLYDERGLYLEISPAGGKWWRFKYRFADKEKRLSLGTYPDVSLQEAREARDTLRKLVAKGKDPAVERRVQKVGAGDSFKEIAEEWIAVRTNPGSDKTVVGQPSPDRRRQAQEQHLPVDRRPAHQEH